MSLQRYIINHQGRMLPVAKSADPGLRLWVKTEDLAAHDARVLQVLKAQHEAIDRLFAHLIEATRGKLDDRPFMPSQSGQPWAACLAGNALIKDLEAGAR